MLALTSATGKLGSAVLNAIIDKNLVDLRNLVICVSIGHISVHNIYAHLPSKTSTNSSDPQFEPYHTRQIPFRYANFDSPQTLETAYTGCTKLFLVSSPRIAMDYNDAALWQGREKHHRAAIDAAVKSGVKHIYYSSLAFANPSKASVMRAHVRTERYLKDLEGQGRVKVTIIREGLYSESWPLYFGYYFALKEERRDNVLVAGDGAVSWTSISDMAYCTAKILSSPSGEWAGKTFYLSQRETYTLRDIADVVSGIRDEHVRIEVVSRKVYEDFYVNEKGMERASVEWWSSTYDALWNGECAIDDPTLESLLKGSGRLPIPFEETVKAMLA